MERPKIDNYIKKDPSEMTTGEILIGYQKYAKALNDYIEKQLRIGAVSQLLSEYENFKLIKQDLLQNRNEFINEFLKERNCGYNVLYKVCSDLNSTKYSINNKFKK